MKWLGLIGFLLCTCIEVWAATVIPVGQFATAKLSWTWIPGPDGGEPTKVYVRCVIGGSGIRTEKVFDVPSGALSMSVLAKEFIQKPGSFSCTLTGWNETGEGPTSAPYPFVLKGGLPPMMTGIKLE